MSKEINEQIDLVDDSHQMTSIDTPLTSHAFKK